MSWALALTALRAHLTAAGLAVTPVIPVVRLAWPQSAVRQITVEYAGDGPNSYGENTLNYRQVGEKVDVKVWVPISSDDISSAEDTELYLRTVKEAIKSAVAADDNLGQTDIAGIEIGDSATAFETWAVQGVKVLFRTLTLTLDIGMTDVSIYART
jgi:hypothetical protein